MEDNIRKMYMKIRPEIFRKMVSEMSNSQKRVSLEMYVITRLPL